MTSAKPVLFIQNNHFDRLGRVIQPCLDFCRDTGHDFVDWSLTDEMDPDRIGVDWSSWPGVILYGSVGWVKKCRGSSLKQWTFYDPERFAASTWVPRFGDLALNSAGLVIDIAAVLSRLASGEKLHLRPNAEDKAFTGGVYDMASWTSMVEQRKLEAQSVPADDLPCFASPIRQISAEYRCWFVDGTLIDVSSYRKDGGSHIERCLDPRVMGAATQLADTYLPDRSVVMDLAMTDDGFKVIEFNPIGSSGWYAADAGQILWALSDMIMRGRQ